MFTFIATCRGSYSHICFFLHVSQYENYILHILPYKQIENIIPWRLQISIPRYKIHSSAYNTMDWIALAKIYHNKAHSRPTSHPNPISISLWKNDKSQSMQSRTACVHSVLKLDCEYICMWAQVHQAPPFDIKIDFGTQGWQPLSQ